MVGTLETSHGLGFTIGGESWGFHLQPALAQASRVAEN
jgi:hypothetical protein